MFERLIESSHRSARSRRDFTISIGTHAAVLLAAGLATRGAEATPPVSHPVSPFVLGVAPHTAAPSGAGGTTSSTAVPSAPAMPAFDDVPAVGILDIPAPAARLGGPTPGAPMRGLPDGVVPRDDAQPGGQQSGFPLVEVDEPVVPLQGPRPSYPAALRQAGIEGTVRLRFVVTARGTVDSTTVVVVRTTHEDFDSAAVGAILAWRFRPARLRGTAVPQLVEQVVRFRLDR